MPTFWKMLAHDRAQEDEGHDHDDRDEGQEQTVLDERLTFLILAAEPSKKSADELNALEACRETSFPWRFASGSVCGA